jgi:nitroreductase
MSVDARQPDHAVDPIFVTRWSRRAFANDAIPHDILMSLFEAARWAPSARNVQPWRFLYALRDGPDWPLFRGLLFERNRIWAERAGALIVVLSKRVHVEDGVTHPWRTHAFDAGAAWANLALQASRLDLNVRAMGGFDRERAPAALGVPEDHDIHVLVAVGRPGAATDLPEHLQELERPNSRRPLSATVTEGRYRP